MDRVKFDLTGTGFPFTTDDIKRILGDSGDGSTNENEGIYPSLSALASMFGDNVVVSGCEVTKTTDFDVASGWIILDGELLYYPGGTSLVGNQYFKKATVTTSQPKTMKSGETGENAYYTNSAELLSTSTAWKYINNDSSPIYYVNKRSDKTFEIGNINLQRDEVGIVHHSLSVDKSYYIFGDDTNANLFTGNFYMSPRGTTYKTDFVIDINGNVGMGVEPSGYKLEVTGNQYTSGNQIINGKIGMGVTSPESYIHIKKSLQSTLQGNYIAKFINTSDLVSNYGGAIYGSIIHSAPHSGYAIKLDANETTELFSVYSNGVINFGTKATYNESTGTITSNILSANTLYTTNIIGDGDVNITGDVIKLIGSTKQGSYGTPIKRTVVGQIQCVVTGGSLFCTKTRGTGFNWFGGSVNTLNGTGNLLIATSIFQIRIKLSVAFSKIPVVMCTIKKDTDGAELGDWLTVRVKEVTNGIIDIYVTYLDGSLFTDTFYVNFIAYDIDD